MDSKNSWDAGVLIETSPRINLIAQQYHISSHILSAIKKLNHHGISYSEILKIFEQWTILLINETGCASRNLVYETINDNFSSSTKIRSMVDDKFIDHEQALVHDFLDNIFKYIHSEIKKYFHIQSKKTSPITVQDNCLVFRKLVIKNIDFLFFRQRYEIFPYEAIVGSYLLYRSIFSRGCQLGTPSKHYHKLYEIFGARNEGFASPFNSRMKYYPDGKYFSVFEIDKELGSSGNFFRSRILDYEGAWVINPPFIEKIILQTAVKIREAYHELIKRQSDRVLTIFLILPYWTDAEGIQILLNSPYLVLDKNLKREKHYYETPEHYYFRATFDSLYLVMSNDHQRVKKKIVNNNFFAELTDYKTLISGRKQIKLE